MLLWNDRKLVFDKDKITFLLMDVKESVKIIKYITQKILFCQINGMSL